MMPVLEKGRPLHLFPTPCAQLHSGGMKSAIMGGFTPWKSATITYSGFSFSRKNRLFNTHQEATTEHNHSGWLFFHHSNHRHALVDCVFLLGLQAEGWWQLLPTNICILVGSPTSFFFLFKDFIYLWETQRQRERQRHRQREKQVPCREPDMGLNPGSPESGPGPKATLNHWATRAAWLSYFWPLLSE